MSGTREMVEGLWDALIELMGSAADVNVYDYDELFDNLSQAITVECKVEHDIEHIDNLGSVEYGTWVRFKGMELEPLWIGSKLIGTAGPALSIILPSLSREEPKRKKEK